MTGLVPSPPDRADYYPDPIGVRTLKWSAGSVVSGTATDLAFQDVYDWATLLISSATVGGAVSAAVVALDWFHDPAGSFISDGDFAIWPVGIPLRVAFPIKAPYLQVQINAVGGAGTHPMGAQYRLASYPAAAYQGPRYALTDDNGAATIAAAATRTYTAPIVRNGTAHWAVAGGAATGFTFDITATDNNGTVHNLVHVQPTAAGYHANGSFQLPPWPVTVTMKNNDAVARSLWHSLTVGP